MKRFIIDEPYSVLNGFGLHCFLFPLFCVFISVRKTRKRSFLITFILFGRLQARRDVVLFIHLFALLFRH
jgi:hypothetical protein